MGTLVSEGAVREGSRSRSWMPEFLQSLVLLRCLGEEDWVPKGRQDPTHQPGANIRASLSLMGLVLVTEGVDSPLFLGGGSFVLSGVGAKNPAWLKIRLVSEEQRKKGTGGCLQPWTSPAHSAPLQGCRWT